MTEGVPLAALLAAAGSELRRMSAELRKMEGDILPILIGHPGMSAALQPLDPLLQRANGLALILETAARGTPDIALPQLAETLAQLRLAQLLPDLQGRSGQQRTQVPDELFGPSH